MGEIMFRKTLQCSMMAGLLAIVGVSVASAQSPQRDYDDVYTNSTKIDRYLDVEIWTNHSDAEYYTGDNIVVHYRVNRDAFVAIYSIDTRGRVNLLFPTDPTADNFVYGGVTYSLPGGDDDYDLVVTGPEGVEHIQIIASRERFPIPNWYHNSGLVCDWEERTDYLDYLNNRYFVRYGGQRFAYDRAVVFINEWEPYYYRPIYYPVYPSWSVCGNVYIGYPYGATIYVNGIYWGCAPLYIPRILVGWHTISIYDYYGYCWETDFHVSRYNTVVFDHTVIKLESTTRSKYTSVRKLGYKDPVKSGYVNFKAKSVKSSGSKSVRSTGVAGDQSTARKAGSVMTRKYVRGSSKMVKTSRGYETVSAPSDYKDGAAKSWSNRHKSSTGSKVGKSGRLKTSSGSTPKTFQRSQTGSKSERSSGYYQKKSGQTGKALSGSSKSAKRTKSTPPSKSGNIKQTKSGSKSGKSIKSDSSEKSKGSKPSGTYKSSGSKLKSGKSTSPGSYKGTKGSSKSSGQSKSVGSSKSPAPKSSGSTKSGSGQAKKSKGGR